MKLIIGLGNPGDEYVRTRHNAGFMVVDAIADKYSFGSFSQKFHGLYTSGEIFDKKVILLKPQTYMNLSGRSAQECAHFFKIPLEDIIVIHDDLDLGLGRIKIKVGGSSAGHNGLKSLDECIGADYTRLRFGIDRSANKNNGSYVLSNFAKVEEPKLVETIDVIVDNLRDLIVGNYTDFMNKSAIALRESKEKK
jgi:peptidyl-tRNA hydrolase, PTH1 family